MGKWIYIDSDNERLIVTVEEALRQKGYATLLETGRGESPVLTVREFSPADSRMTMGDVTLDLDNVAVCGDKVGAIHLTPIEFAMLRYLMQNRGRAVSRDELLPAVWGFANDAGSRVADDTVKRLRRKLAGTSLRVETVWGFGFKLAVKE